MRGEEAGGGIEAPLWTEIPPRARRRDTEGASRADTNGNTSACAEKSTGMRRVLPRSWKYLRVRGEERPGGVLLGCGREIPPRARRRGGGEQGFEVSDGNTSACAEKSPTRVTTRGFISEIPPRARRRGFQGGKDQPTLGNTSACAEKRVDAGKPGRHARKYLRVRGEETYDPDSQSWRMEIPPRARRRARSDPHTLMAEGNTSACAEKRTPNRRRLPVAWKYLRVRGEEIRYTPR